MTEEETRVETTEETPVETRPRVGGDEEEEEGGRGGQTRRPEIEEEDTSGSDAEPVVLVPIVELDACGC
jgi:hypothetical protein